MSGSCSQYSRKSLPDRSALSPIETNDENPMPRAAAASIAAIPNPPLCEAKATSPGGGAAGATVAFERDLGPRIRHAEAVRADHPHARRPADGEQLVLARTPRGTDLREARRQDDERAHALGGAGSRDVDDRVRRHDDHGELDLTLDVGDRADRRPPRHLSAVHVDEVQRPREAGGEQVAHDLPADRPGPPRRPDHRDGGRAQHVPHGGDVGLALALLEAPPRVLRQRRRELDLDRSLRPAGGDQEPGFVEDPEHPVVAREDGRGERVDTRRRRGLGEMREQDGGDPVAVPGIGHREGDLRPLGAPRRRRCRAPTIVASAPRTAISDSPSDGGRGVARGARRG